ncbi:MAG: rRNA maturation RNase YbeY [Lewinellaceae bacterium]|nr:rRNA maturation RNase YbeY [Lewinellaceae bacterium]
MNFPELPEQTEQTLSFFFEDVEFDLPGEAGLRAWLTATAEAEGKTMGEINCIFCSDEHLRGINVEFLDHDYYTDIITFDYSEGSRLHGEIYISSERVADNAQTNGVSFLHELCRVMVHGILHMAGYKDKTPEDESIMRKKEDYYLTRL